MCPVIAIACKTFFLVFLKSRWIKWHKHDTSFHQKVVLESPIRTAARSVGEEHKHFSRQKNKRKGGQVLLDPQSFIWRIFLLHKQYVVCLPCTHTGHHQLEFLRQKRPKTAPAIWRIYPWKWKIKIEIFWVLVTSDHCDTQYTVVHSPVSFVIPRKISERRDLATQN